MSTEQILNILAALALILFGVYAIVQPGRSAALAHLTPDDANGRAEIRIAFGALSVGMGLAPLVINQPAAYQALGLVWLVVGAARILAALVDRPKLDRMYIVSGLFEWLVGLIFLL
jgi:uncharacterized membrane protein HdeD (DUF308 family)